MKADATKITDGVYWVGVLDWDLRDYHGYSLDGTTYNCYLVFGEDKVALISKLVKTEEESFHTTLANGENLLNTALKEHAKVIGLSALMTTTMMRMKDVVELVKEEQLDVKVIIGGAVITQSFADEIGADGYSCDAADCVKLVQALME